MSDISSTVLCKGGMHHVPPTTIVAVRNGRKICSACHARILARLGGSDVRPPKRERGVGHPALPNAKFRMLRRG